MMNSPLYYEKFKCIANECAFTCCQEWRIAVDEKTHRAWETKTLEGLEKPLSAYAKDGAICLNESRVCPFLDEHKLCRVVSRYGEEAISNTCHTYPREIHRFDEMDYEERTLTMSCPAALDLLWEEGLEVDSCRDHGELFLLREKCMEQIRNPKNSIEEALLLCFFVLLDLDEQGEDADVTMAFHESFVEELRDAIKKVDRDEYATFMECNELLLDLAVNYRNKGMYQSILEPLCLCAEKYEELTEGEFAKKASALRDFHSEFRKFEEQLRLLVEEEIYSTLVLPESDLYSVLMKLQWISLTYATIRHCLFITYEKNNQITLESLKEIIVMLLRMTGYSEEDIEEYLENCFEEVIWDWGYMALIL